MSSFRSIVSFSATLAAGIWLGYLAYLALPDSVTSWGVRFTYSSSQAQLLQLYHSSDDEWFGEENTVNRNLGGDGKEVEESVFLPLPRASITKLRLDPVAASGEFGIKDVRVVGPCGFLVREIALEVDRANGLVSAGDDRFVADGDDPWFFVNFKREPLAAPTFWIVAIALLVIAAVCLLTVVARYWVPVCGNRWLGAWRALSVLILLGFYTVYFVSSERQVDPRVFYLGLLPVLTGLIVFTLCEHPEQITRYRSAAFLLPLAFLLYFGFHAVLAHENFGPGRGAVLTALLALVFTLAAFVVFWQDRPPLSLPVLGGLIRVYLLITALVAAYWIVDYHSPTWDLITRMQQAATFPLYRPISGSACFAMGLLLLAFLPPSSRMPKLDLLFVVPVVLVLTMWLLLCQSRGPMISIGGTLLGLVLLHRKASSGVVLLTFVALVMVFVATPFPRWAGEILHRKAAVSEAVPRPLAEQQGVPGQVLPKSRKPKAKELRLLRRHDQSRSQIYRRFLSEIPNHWVLGHGFSAAPALEVGLEHMRAEYHNATRTPHSVHLSVLYFGGLVGFALLSLVFAKAGLGLFLRSIRKSDQVALLLLGFLVFAFGCISVEGTLIADSKEAVLFWKPNGYWLYLWIPLFAGLGYLASLPSSAGCAPGTQATKGAETEGTG